MSQKCILLYNSNTNTTHCYLAFRLNLMFGKLIKSIECSISEIFTEAQVKYLSYEQE